MVRMNEWMVSYWPRSALHRLSIKNLNWTPSTRMNLVIHHVLQTLVVGWANEDLRNQLPSSMAIVEHLFKDNSSHLSLLHVETTSICTQQLSTTDFNEKLLNTIIFNKVQITLQKYLLLLLSLVSTGLEPPPPLPLDISGKSSPMTIRFWISWSPMPNLWVAI